MTELETAHKNNSRSIELAGEIEKCREYQMSCKKANDNIGDKVWADHIKTLKAEKHAIEQTTKYTNFTLFAQVVKTKLTPSEYDDCWRMVDAILENPKLMQG